MATSRFKNSTRATTCEGNTLITTSRSSFISRARYTSPILPTPIWAGRRIGEQSLSVQRQLDSAHIARGRQPITIPSRWELARVTVEWPDFTDFALFFTLAAILQTELYGPLAACS